MQLTRSKFASDNVFLVEQFTTLLEYLDNFRMYTKHCHHLHMQMSIERDC